MFTTSVFTTAKLLLFHFTSYEWTAFDLIANLRLGSRKGTVSTVVRWKNNLNGPFTREMSCRLSFWHKRMSGNATSTVHLTFAKFSVTFVNAFQFRIELMRISCRVVWNWSNRDAFQRCVAGGVKFFFVLYHFNFCKQRVLDLSTLISGATLIMIRLLSFINSCLRGKVTGYNTTLQ